MSVNGSVSGSASKILVLSVGNVGISPGISVFFGQAKVNDINKVPSFPCNQQHKLTPVSKLYSIYLFKLTKTHEKVVWFDISVNEVFRMDIFNSAYKLVSK